MQFIDQCNRTIYVDRTPKRIVSLVPSQTELLYDLGLEEEVVGITKFCVHPQHWFENKERIGGTKKLHLEKIRELDPDLIIANKEENTKEEIEALAEEFPVWISDIFNLEDSYKMILSIGNICAKEAEAKRIVSQIKDGFTRLTRLEEPISCLYFIWQKPYMLCSSETFISSLLDICGFKNLAFSIGNRYPEATKEQLLKLKPDVIFLSSEPYPFNEKHRFQIEKDFSGSKAILVDGEMFSWYGSRLRYSTEYLQNLQYKVLELLQ